jgi:DNA-directed RNA polymerase I and III subunit RPAC2
MSTESSRLAAAAAPKLQILANADESTGTVIISGEDHTLGNSLRYILSKQISTDFVGYTIPHPSEHKIQLRLQTKPFKSEEKPKQTQRITVSEALNSGLSQLEQLCDIISGKFEEAEKRAIEQGVKKTSYAEPTETQIHKIVQNAKEEAANIRKQHEDTNMEELD